MTPRDLMAELKRLYPLKSRLVVRWLEEIPGNLDGLTTISDSGKQITIRICTKRTFAVQWDTVIHEYAHARDLDQWDPHGPLWAKFYGQNYSSCEQFKE